MSSYIIFDLEATCWEKGTRLEDMEIIEIGAVRLDVDSGEIVGEFSCFVQPVERPELSDFCTQLTGIQQDDVADAKLFADALEAFADWIGSDVIAVCSWGAYDIRQLRVECRRHGAELAVVFGNHVNLKGRFAELQGGHRFGVKRALRKMGLRFEGSHHRALDDARNIAKLARLILPGFSDEDSGRGVE
jgi:inhibitor of KinA sporulation pathway (predicted exonuclease)